jgi:hypothetical protein
MNPKDRLQSLLRDMESSQGEEWRGLAFEARSILLANFRAYPEEADRFFKLVDDKSPKSVSNPQQVIEELTTELQMTNEQLHLRELEIEDLRAQLRKSERAK